MTEQELFSKNLMLSTEFDRYVLEYPGFGENIPPNAQIVLLPEHDPELCQKNLELSERQHEDGQPIVYVHIQDVAPQISRLINPKIQIKAA
jgi:hypothetical protein